VRMAQRASNLRKGRGSSRRCYQAKTKQRIGGFRGRKRGLSPPVERGERGRAVLSTDSRGRKTTGVIRGDGGGIDEGVLLAKVPPYGREKWDRNGFEWFCRFLLEGKIKGEEQKTGKGG